MMCDGFWDGRGQAMNIRGVPKGMKQVLLERGVNVHRMMASEMEILGSHADCQPIVESGTLSALKR